MATKRVACVLGQGFEDSEFRVPYDRLRAAGFTVDIISPSAGQELSGYKGKEKVKSDRGIDEVRPEQYDALLIPGGQSPDHLRADPRFVAFVKAFDATQRPLAAVCHGPQLLISAGLVKGRTLTAWKTIQEDLRQIGAQVRDEQVVIDRNWITSRQPDDLTAFSDALIRALGEDRPSEVDMDEDSETEEPATRRPRADIAGDRPSVTAEAATHRDTQDQLDHGLSDIDEGSPRRR
jgi:protease I